MSLDDVRIDDDAATLEGGVRRQVVVVFGALVVRFGE
ncbi:hypothetical protein BJY17_003410 [Agromyces hippuratus]|uniref:Uncharacterized protein n=1 Tax=Agromyces hippuratus TaxID=286438 RepID=A0A852X3G3_9MICO|nr:hypothetical protein [Agromyces hippuratus]